jgi:urea-proton symporter
MAGELIGTLSIVAISGLTVLIAGLVGGQKFNLADLKKMPDEMSATAVGAE